MAADTVILAAKDSASEKAARARSTIEFPYGALDDAEEIAKGVRDVGVTGCQWDQLAASMNFASGGGGFRVRMISAKTFNLLSYDRGTVTLTDLGMRIADPTTSRGARVDAFLSVPLYKQAFDKLKGQTLPPVAAIERLLENLGVAPKQKDKARQAFMRSAKHAGFMELAQDRMTMPVLAAQPASEQEKPKDEEREQRPESRRGNGGNGGDHYHPFIRGLLDKLPPPESEWSAVGRAKWLQTAANIFDLIYTDMLGEETSISVIVKKESP